MASINKRKIYFIITILSNFAYSGVIAALIAFLASNFFPYPFSLDNWILAWAFVICIKLIR